MRNDAFNNLLDSLAVVAEYELYEVVVLSKFQVFRANRSSKVVRNVRNQAIRKLRYYYIAELFSSHRNQD